MLDFCARRTFDQKQVLDFGLHIIRSVLNFIFKEHEQQWMLR